MDKKTWSTRLDEETEKKVKVLIEKSGLKEAEVLRRLIIIGLKYVREPADLLKTSKLINKHV
jgi:predicted DNA-binding protein